MMMIMTYIENGKWNIELINMHILSSNIEIALFNNNTITGILVLMKNIASPSFFIKTFLFFCFACLLNNVHMLHTACHLQYENKYTSSEIDTISLIWTNILFKKTAVMSRIIYAASYIYQRLSFRDILNYSYIRICRLGEKEGNAG